ncbi:MAG: hypothetical protein SEPTF4163_001239 [Sporothrix epigloea]
MAFVTEQQKEIVLQNPLDEFLDDSREELRNLEDIEPCQAHIARPFAALIKSSAAWSLRFPDECSIVADQLFTLRKQIDESRIDLGNFGKLIRRVVDGSSDFLIWAEIFNLVDSLLPQTPPSSNRLSNSETRKVVEKEIFKEIKDCIYRNGGGFWDKYFTTENWTDEQHAMLEKTMTAHSKNGWEGLPRDPREELVWDWLCSLEKRFLSKAPNRLHRTTTSSRFEDEKGQLDFFFLPKTAKSTAKSVSEKFSFKDVLVDGEHKRSYDTGRFKADLLQLFCYVRSVFADQPTRRFVHAFTFCNYHMEVWIVDRSGAYSPGPFDIRQEAEKFARCLVSYATMNEDGMGLNTFIMRQDGLRSIIVNDGSDKPMKINLVQAIVKSKGIVSRGTTCYKTEDGHVAKFSWAPKKLKSEVETLKLAEEKGVQGVVRLVAHCQITDIQRYHV